MDDLYLYSYDYLRLIFIILVTFLSFLWVRKVNLLKIKIWYILLAVFMLIYSGIGGAITEVDFKYSVYYAIYIASLGGALCYLYNRKIKGISIDNREESRDVFFSVTTSRVIITSYYLTLLFPLMYPEFRMGLLLHPPTPTLEGLHFATFVEGKNMDFVSSLVYLISQLLSPFFYLCVYKYRKSPLKVLLFFLLPVYFDLCDRSIFGRGELMVPLLIVGLGMFEDATAKTRRRLLILAGMAIPFISLLLVQFSEIRIGDAASNISYGDAMQILLGQEISYPTQFSDYFGKESPISIFDYILWLILLPLPGFLKFGYGDPKINLYFTMMVTGLDPSNSIFSICLPGLTGEGIFVFGQYLFPLHAVILAVLISVMVKYLSSNDSYKYIFYYAALLFSYNVCRAGTMSAYSFFFKQFLLFVIVMYFVKRRKSSMKT